jgi:hypothetical protein
MVLSRSSINQLMVAGSHVEPPCRSGAFAPRTYWTRMSSSTSILSSLSSPSVRRSRTKASLCHRPMENPCSVPKEICLYAAPRACEAWGCCSHRSQRGPCLTRHCNSDDGQFICIDQYHSPRGSIDHIWSKVGIPQRPFL